MMKKAMLGKFRVITLSATMLAGGILPSVAGAQTNETNLINSTIPISYNLEYINGLQSSGSENVVEVSTSDVVEVLRNQGYAVDEFLAENDINPYVRGAGTNKLVFTSDGHMDVYVNKLTLQIAGGLGVAAIAAILAAIPIAGPAISTITSVVLSTLVGNIAHGKVYRFKTYKQSGMIKSVLYKKSWNQ